VKEEKLRDVAGGEVECGDDIVELLAGDRWTLSACEKRSEAVRQWGRGRLG